MILADILFCNKQGRIHSNPVADGWAGAVVRKPLGIQQGRIHGSISRGRVGRSGKPQKVTLLPTDGPTDGPKSGL